MGTAHLAFLRRISRRARSADGAAFPLSNSCVSMGFRSWMTSLGNRRRRVQNPDPEAVATILHGPLKVGVLHVHLHDLRGTPRFSRGADVPQLCARPRATSRAVGGRMPLLHRQPGAGAHRAGELPAAGRGRPGFPGPSRGLSALACCLVVQHTAAPPRRPASLRGRYVGVIALTVRLSKFRHVCGSRLVRFGASRRGQLESDWT